MADQQAAPVMLDDELRANMTHEEQIKHLEALVRRVRDQWQAEHREHLQRSNNQEREIARLCDKLQASQDEAAHAWSLVPDARQREEIEKRTNWTTYQPKGGTAIVAECTFRGEHFQAEQVISKERLESVNSASREIRDASRRLSAGILASACKALGIRTEEQEVNLEILARQGGPIEVVPAPAAVPSNWKPIETAPLDNAVLVRDEDDDCYKAQWNREFECWTALCGQPVVYAPEPIEWTELPGDAPAPAEPFTEHSRPEDDAQVGRTLFEEQYQLQRLSPAIELLKALRDARPLVLHGEGWIEEINNVLAAFYADLAIDVEQAIRAENAPALRAKPAPQRCHHHEKGDSNQ